MRLRVLILTVLVSVLDIGTGAAQQDRRTSVEAFMSAALLERGAFRACADLEKDADRVQLVEFLERTWRLDVTDMEKMLREARYADDFIRSLSARLKLDVAIPKFADRPALMAFCAAVGDWQERWATFNFMTPQVGLSRILKGQ